MEAIASFPWYPYEWLKPQYDVLWSCVRDALKTKGIHAPVGLSPSRDYRTHWAAPDLLLSQCCGYNIANKTQELTVVAAPHFNLDGIAPGQYRSVVIVRASEATNTVKNLRGRRAAFNEHQSYSGNTALFSAIPEKLRGPDFFSSTVPTGSHLESMRAVVNGEADVAAIDEVSFLLITDKYPDLEQRLARIHETENVQAPPYVTALKREPHEINAISDALIGVSRTEAAKDALKSMRVRAIIDATNECYRPLEKKIKEIEDAVRI